MAWVPSAAYGTASVTSGEVSTLPIGYHVRPGLGFPAPAATEVPLPRVRRAQVDTLRRLMLYAGCPAAFRAAVWYEMSGAHAIVSVWVGGRAGSGRPGASVCWG